MGKFRALETDLERMKEKIEVENEAKAEIQKAMSKALAEAQIWKSKYTTEACARIEDLENAKAKLLVCKLQKLLFLSKKDLGEKPFLKGCIVVTGAPAALRGRPMTPAFAASKAAQRMLVSWSFSCFFATSTD